MNEILFKLFTETLLNSVSQIISSIQKTKIVKETDLHDRNLNDETVLFGSDSPHIESDERKKPKLERIDEKKRFITIVNNIKKLKILMDEVRLKECEIVRKIVEMDLLYDEFCEKALSTQKHTFAKFELMTKTMDLIESKEHC